ncbi:unnamed protein product, partial [Tuber aestivum]
MESPAPDFTDRYIAQLLERDAAEQSSRFSRVSRACAPKPNTRFLRNIVREVDSHNAALLAREQRRRSRSRSRTRSRSRSRSRRRRRRRREEEREDREDRHSSARVRRHRHRHHRRPRSHSRSHSRSRSRSRSRSPSPHRHHRHRSHHRRRHRRRRNSSSRTRHISSTPAPGESREELIGPQPPPPPARGRGGTTTTDGQNPMDAHFASSYDPTQDSLFHPPSNLPSDDEWDTALEAYRDRQRLKSLHAERLRVAGFGEEIIRTWEKSKAGGEEDIEGIKWGVRGGVREWDRGK